MITKDGRDTAIENLTPENYIVPKGEERCYHCVIEVKLFDNRTAQKLSKPRVQKFGKKIFERTVRDVLIRQGYEVKILHNPNDWEKQQAAKKQEAANAAKAAAEAKYKADVEAEVARRLAAMQGKESGEKKPGRKQAEK